MLLSLLLLCDSLTLGLSLFYKLFFILLKIFRAQFSLVLYECVLTVYNNAQ